MASTNYHTLMVVHCYCDECLPNGVPGIAPPPPCPTVQYSLPWAWSLSLTIAIGKLHINIITIIDIIILILLANIPSSTVLMLTKKLILWTRWCYGTALFPNVARRKWIPPVTSQNLSWYLAIFISSDRQLIISRNPGKFGKKCISSVVLIH